MVRLLRKIVGQQKQCLLLFYYYLMVFKCNNSGCIYSVVTYIFPSVVAIPPLIPFSIMSNISRVFSAL